MAQEENPFVISPSTREKNEAFKQARMDKEKKVARIEQEAKDKKIAEDNKKKANAANSKDKDNRKKLGRDDLKTLDVGDLITQKPKNIFEMIGFLQANLEEREDELKADPDLAKELESKIAEIQEAVKNNGITYDPQEENDEDILPENNQQNAPKDLDNNETLGHANKKQGLDNNLLDPSKFNAAAKAVGDNDVISSTAFKSPSAGNQGGGVVQEQRPSTSVSNFSSFNLWASETAKRRAAIEAANHGATSDIGHLM